MKKQLVVGAVAVCGAGVLWWKFRAPAGSVTVEESSNEVAVSDVPYIAPLLDALEKVGFPVGTPRGIRNNNPGNIEYSASTPWRGIIGTDGRYCIFDTPINGIRAIQRILNTYAARGVDTVREVITSWAPPMKNGVIENNTAAYISAVASACGVGADQVPNRMQLIKAIIRHENGQNPYTDSQIIAGMNAA